MRHRMKTRVVLAALSIGLALTACSAGTDKSADGTEIFSETEESGGLNRGSAEKEHPEMDSGQPSASTDPPPVNAGTSAVSTKEPALGADADGIKGAPETSPRQGLGADYGRDDGQEIQIGLPLNESWYSNPVYSAEEKIQQVTFHDEITGSDAIVRACREEDGDPSVFYYMFDDSKRESWFTNTEEGTRIDIAVEVTVENSDIHGVLATWGHNGVLYALWEDDAVDSVDGVAKIAMEIADRSR